MGNVARSVDRECPLIEVFGRRAHQKTRPDRAGSLFPPCATHRRSIPSLAQPKTARRRNDGVVPFCEMASGAPVDASLDLQVNWISDMSIQISNRS